MSNEAKITLIKGEGKGNKARYAINGTEVPAAAITRLMDKIKGMEERLQARKFTSALDEKYGQFLDALDKAGLSTSEAIAQIFALSTKPEKTKRTAKGSNLARMAAKVMSKVYSKKTPAEMVDEFVKLVVMPAFREDATAYLTQMENDLGRSSQGKIRMRKARPDMVNVAKRAREAKQK